MTIPYFITTEMQGADLFELDDGRFQLISQGEVAPYAYGHKHLLVENSLADYLKSMNLERVRYEPVVILSMSKREESRTHTRVHVGECFKSNEIHDLALEGLRLPSMSDKYFFASPSLKRTLEASTFKYLRFTEGLSGFASDAA
jgi:hypothetical protein